MSQIYKINHITENNIDKIFIFTGGDIIDTTNYIDSQGNHIFSIEEFDNIKKTNIPWES